MDRTKLLRWLSFATSVLSIFVAGGVFSFPTYNSALKFTLNYTQTEVNTIFSLGFIGMSMSFPAGWLYMKAGPLILCIISLGLSVIGYLLLWLAVGPYKPFFQSNSWLLGIIYFVAGHSSVYLYIAALMCALYNFSYSDHRNRGLIVGSMDASYGMGSAVLSYIYNRFFMHGYVEQHEEHQDLKGYFLLTTILFVAASSLAAALLREYPRNEEVDFHTVPTLPDVRDLTSRAYEYPELDGQASRERYLVDTVPIVGSAPFSQVTFNEPIDQSQQSSLPRRSSSLLRPQRQHEISDNVTEVSCFRVFKLVEFYFLVWPFFLVSGFTLTVFTNLEAITKALDLEYQSTTCAIILIVASCISRVACGLVSDRTKNHIPRANFIFVSLLGVFVIQAFSIFFLRTDTFPVLILFTVFTGIAYGAVWCLTPTIMSEIFGLKYFGVNWGFTQLFAALIALAQQRAFGAIYDHYSEPSMVCSGVNCFRWSIVMMAGLTIISMICTLCLIRQKITDNT